MTHVMLDLETWGTIPGSAIRSIGACTFDPDGQGTGAKFYRNISDVSCEVVGLVRDANTIAWWARQSAEAQAVFTQQPGAISNVLWSLSAWWQQVGGEEIWSHGANFDQPIIEAAYRAVGMQAPWSFWNSRCTRTAYALAGIDTRKMLSTEIKHHALHDAKAQARAVQAAVAYLRNRRQPAEFLGVVETIAPASTTAPAGDFFS